MPRCIGNVKGSRQGMSATAIQTGLRIPPDDLQEIDRRARERGITRTALLIDGALERLPEQQTALNERLDQLERDVERLQTALFG